jgi:hypothetical protein
LSVNAENLTTEDKFKKILGDKLFEKLNKLHPDLNFLISFLNEFINPQDPHQVFNLVLELEAVGKDFRQIKPYGDGSLSPISERTFEMGFPKLEPIIGKILLHVRSLYLERNIKTGHFDRQGTVSGPHLALSTFTPYSWQTMYRIGPERFRTNRYIPRGIKIKSPKPIKKNSPSKKTE